MILICFDFKKTESNTFLIFLNKFLLSPNPFVYHSLLFYTWPETQNDIQALIYCAICIYSSFMCFLSALLYYPIYFMQSFSHRKQIAIYLAENELPRSRAAGYLKGRSTTYNPINSAVLAPVRFDRASYTLFLDLVLLRILISLLHFHAPLP